MSKQICKYPLETSCNEINIPVGSEILHCHAQHEKPCLWVLVDTKKPMLTRKFTVYRTGDDVDMRKRDYIGTVHCHYGSIVLHVFEELR